MTPLSLPIRKVILTETTLVSTKFTVTAAETLDEGSMAVLILLDLSAIFHVMDRQILANRLELSLHQGGALVLS